MEMFLPLSLSASKEILFFRTPTLSLGVCLREFIQFAYANVTHIIQSDSITEVSDFPLENHPYIHTVVE